MDQGPDKQAAPGSSGITVIIVGLGLGGLTAAIECRRKGHNVIAIDKQKELKPIGDSIGIANNAAFIVRRWADGAVDRRLQAVIAHPDVMAIYDNKGELLVNSDLSGYGRGYGYPAHRGDLAMAFYEHAKELGVTFRLGHQVLEYFETDTEAGVVLDGQRVTADCVVAADGIHSKARGAVLGTDPAPHSSGYAMYRSWFDAGEVAADPETRWILDGAEQNDVTKLYLGQDIHVMVGTAKLGKEIFWMCTHKDVYDVSESWSYPGKIDDALEYIKDWPITAKLEPLLRKTPAERLIDFKLLWRDPLPTWVSAGGRLVVIGDAAHAFLPTSGQGAAQAMEDAATVAICLEQAGKHDIPLALRTMQALRYRRATLMQQIGFETRNQWHQTDWEAVKKDATLLEIPRPSWVFLHDSQAYAYDEFARAADTVRRGTEYTPTNIPDAGVFHRTMDFHSAIAQQARPTNVPTQRAGDKILVG
ncbi:hypothetical protein SEUCBS140593_010163 [Sporothrix eucalyptigena]|uniref:FAD-binding domain-containing protein n=1 Tax=Sporothrix eucalyptigena TaxID=1812306 RepID=A0ABP0D0C6_9PEZI